MSTENLSRTREKEERDHYYRSSGRRRGRWSRRWQRFSHKALEPVRILHNFLDHWSFGQILLQWAHRIGQFFGALLVFHGRTIELSSEDDTVAVSKMPSAKTMANPLWWVVWFVQFPWLWFISRPFLKMSLALPAIVLLAFGIIATSTFSARRVSSQLRQEMLRAAESQEYELAALVGKNLIQLNPWSVKDYYRLALIEQDVGNDDEAHSTLQFAARRLRSEDAALWLADHIGDRQHISKWTPEQLDAYSEWLQIAIEVNPSNGMARKAMADALRVRGDLNGAYDVLEPLGASDPAISYLLIVLEKELGREDAAKSKAEMMVSMNLKAIAKNPSFFQTRLQTASLMAFLEQYQQAVDVLQDGLPYAKSDQEKMRLRRGIADGMVLVAAEIAKTDRSPRGLMKRFEQLQQAVKMDATSPAVIDAVTQACLQTAQSNDNELIVLREAIVQGVSAESAHFILGTLALYQGDLDQALEHLEIAVKSNPNIPGLLNNLAYAISLQENPDLERALRLVNAAIHSSPESPYARETRGQIMLKLHRWNEAIADLEFAMQEPKLKKQVRQGLAEAFEHLGMQDLAERHRELLAKGL